MTLFLSDLYRRRDVENVKTPLAVMKMVKGWHPDAPKGSITGAHVVSTARALLLQILNRITFYTN